MYRIVVVVSESKPVTTHLADQLICVNARLSRVIAEALDREVGLSLPWYLAMTRLAQRDGHLMKMNELAEEVTLSTSGTTRIVDRIEEAGLVRRQDCKEDRRVSYVVLTSTGRALLEKAQPVYRQAVDGYLRARLDPDSLHDLGELVAKLHG